MATLAIKAWCTEHNSMCVVSPSGRYYVMLSDPDGEAPVLAYFGADAITVAKRLEKRHHARYAVDHPADPIDLGDYL